MIILGIDPGPKESGFVIWDTDKRRPTDSDIMENDSLKSYLHCGEGLDTVAIEWLTGYGQIAGNDVYETCRWVGKFEECIELCPVELIPRKDIKRHLCGNTTTNDKYVRQALIDRFGEQGTKKNPGPLYGISGHMWSALAVAVTAADRLKGG